MPGTTKKATKRKAHAAALDDTESEDDENADASECWTCESCGRLNAGSSCPACADNSEDEADRNDEDLLHCQILSGAARDRDSIACLEAMGFQTLHVRAALQANKWDLFRACQELRTDAFDTRNIVGTDQQPQETEPEVESQALSQAPDSPKQPTTTELSPHSPWERMKAAAVEAATTMGSALSGFSPMMLFQQQHGGRQADENVNTNGNEAVVGAQAESVEQTDNKRRKIQTRSGINLETPAQKARGKSSCKEKDNAELGTIRINFFKTHQYYCPLTQNKFCGGECALLRAMQANALVTIRREAGNIADSNAIMLSVVPTGMGDASTTHPTRRAARGAGAVETIGYVRREIAKVLAPLLDRKVVQLVDGKGAGQAAVRFTVLPGHRNRTSFTPGSLQSLACFTVVQEAEKEEEEEENEEKEDGTQ